MPEEEPKKKKEVPLRSTRQYADAVAITVEAKKGSAYLLQEKLGISYACAVSFMDQMEEDGIIGPADGIGPRKVLKHGKSLSTLPGEGLVGQSADPDQLSPAHR
jgi:hypothetical protein